MSKLTNLLDKLKKASEKVSEVRDKFGGIVQAKNQVKVDREELEALKDSAMKEARARIVKLLKAKVGKKVPTTPTVDVSPESIVSKL